MQSIIVNTQYKPFHVLQANYRRRNISAKLHYQTKHARKVCLIADKPRYTVLSDDKHYYVGKLVNGVYCRDSKNMCLAFANKLAATRNNKA